MPWATCDAGTHTLWVWSIRRAASQCNHRFFRRHHPIPWAGCMLYDFASFTPHTEEPRGKWILQSLRIEWPANEPAPKLEWKHVLDDLSQRPLSRVSSSLRGKGQCKIKKNRFQRISRKCTFTESARTRSGVLTRKTHSLT